jgi:uncharacterized membrane protein
LTHILGYPLFFKKINLTGIMKKTDQSIPADTGSAFANLLRTNNAALKKLHAIVENTFREEHLITQKLLHPPAELLSSGQRVSDKVAHFGGSWAFIISFGIVLFAWILFNSLTPEANHFDPFPFILMNLILSCIAAMQAPIIMMSQNRKEEKDRKRAENDYLINLKAELEVRHLHMKLDLLMEEQMSRLIEVQAEQLRLLNELAEKTGLAPRTKK